jgi:hypothetical protein
MMPVVLAPIGEGAIVGAVASASNIRVGEPSRVTPSRLR